MTLSVSRLRELLDYEPETGMFKWRQTRCGRAMAGNKAGNLRKDAKRDALYYINIKIDDKTYLAHRLAWLHVYGVWPSCHIDHIDGDGTNNRFANLRAATQSENGRNTGRSKANSSGFKGVSWHKKTKKWTARIMVHGRSKSLGYFSTPEAAHNAYRAAAIDMHGEFARAA